MDKFDLKILKELEKNARVSSPRLGKAVGRSQQFVDYRLNALKTFKPWPIITPQIITNQFKLGLRSFLLFVKLEDPKKVFDFFYKKAKKNSSVNWVIATGYDWDVIVMITNKDIESLYSTVTQLFKGEDVFDFDMREIVKHQMLAHTYLTKNKITIEHTTLTSPIKLDSVDFKILKELNKAYNVKIVNITSKLKLNYRTIASRIKKMQELKIITGFRPFINPKPFGYRSYFIKFTTNIKTDYDLDKFLRLLSEDEYVTDSFEFLGRFSNAVIYRYTSEGKTKEFLEKLRNAVPKLQDLSIFPMFDDTLYNSVIE
jgi:Lrp/AsnC family leucine-responsive transcriptional regulator